MNTFWGQMGIELLGGTIGSFIFLFIILFWMRPRIAIANTIAKLENTFDQETPYTFVFKIVNCSWFDAYEIQLELYEVNYYPAVPNGMHRRLTEIMLKRNHLKQIPARKRLKKGSMLADHCVTFRTNQDLQATLTDQRKAIELHITSKHGLTGLSKVYRMDYRSLSCIKAGNFRFGSSFDIS
jgi:hypothetical protein